MSNTRTSCAARLARLALEKENKILNNQAKKYLNKVKKYNDRFQMVLSNNNQLRIKENKEWDESIKKAGALWALVCGAKSRAAKKGLDFDLDLDWCVEKNTGYCELTGLPYASGFNCSNVMSPSIDKIDPSLGYVKSNCRVVLFGVNLLKFTGTDDTMIKIAKALVNNYGKYKDKNKKVNDS